MSHEAVDLRCQPVIRQRFLAEATLRLKEVCGGYVGPRGRDLTSVGKRNKRPVRLISFVKDRDRIAPKHLVKIGVVLAARLHWGNEARQRGRVEKRREVPTLDGGWRIAW